VRVEDATVVDRGGANDCDHDALHRTGQNGSMLKCKRTMYMQAREELFGFTDLLDNSPGHP